MRTIDYREALGIGFNDSQKVDALINLIRTTFSTLNSYVLSAKAKAFYENPTIDFTAYYRAVCEVPFNNDYDELSWVLQSIVSCCDIPSIIFKYVAFMNSMDKCFKGFPDFKDAKQFVLKELPNHLDAIGVSYSKIKDNEGIFIFPKGAPELDVALVSEPLEWLKDYPAAHKTYVTALKQYSDGIYIRDVADNLRKTLEAFLQEFLGNSKNLETNKNEICKYLGEQGVDSGITGLFQPLINAYKNINDRIAKHNDAVDAKMLEFLLYQTGVLIRMVLEVKRAESETSK